MLDVEALQAIVSGQRWLGSDINIGCKKTDGVGFFYTAMQHWNSADTREILRRIDVHSARDHFVLLAKRRADKNSSISTLF